tara:strand:- start:83 stop:1141 length:1059 start_codon:yes stop_codon:yes gene_type:complete
MFKKIIKSLFVCPYFLFSSLYFFLFKINFLKTKQFKNLFVLSVGNLTVGGAGKTPFILLLSKLLSREKIKHAIISRGYKKNRKGNIYMMPSDKTLKYDSLSFGDEPFLLFKALKNVPVFVGNKILSLLKMEEVFSGKVALLDDGFQTHGLFKNINILLLDCSLKASSYSLLPLGLLREPLKEIKRADVVVLTKTNLSNSKNLFYLKKQFGAFIDSKKQLVLTAELLFSVFSFKNKCFTEISAVLLDSKNLISLCGVANPLSFKFGLDKLNIKTSKDFVFADHHKYSPKNIKKILSFCKKNEVSSIITTKKDLYKIKNYFENFQLYVVDIEHKILESSRLENYLKKSLMRNFK